LQAEVVVNNFLEAYKWWTRGYVEIIDQDIEPDVVKVVLHEPKEY
jgi:hypothetical protein